RFYVERRNEKLVSSHKQRKTILIGAGEGGQILFNSLLGSRGVNQIEVVGFVDDDPNKQNMYLSNARVLGKISDLPHLVDDYQIDMVTIAIPSLSRHKLRKVVRLLEDKPVKVNYMPSIEDIASGKVSMSRFKNIDVIDLLERDEVQLDTAK